MLFPNTENVYLVIPIGKGRSHKDEMQWSYVMYFNFNGSNKWFVTANLFMQQTKHEKSSVSRSKMPWFLSISPMMICLALANLLPLLVAYVYIILNYIIYV